MTEEQPGGTAPEQEANASSTNPASDDTVAAIAVADEPAAIEAPETTDDPSPAADVSSAAPSTEESSNGQVTAAADDSADDATPTSEAAAEPVTAVEPAAADAEASAAPATDAAAPAPETAAPADTEADFADAPAAADVDDHDEPPPPPRELGPEPTTMEELLAEQDSDIKSFKHGDVVEGKVVRIDKDEMLVDIGAKSEGVVSNRELYGRHAETQPQLAIGDTVLVYVLQPESQEGHVVLSLRRAGLERKWRAMQEQFEAGVIIEAPVIDHNKGGLIVDCGIRGFVPISQIVDFPRRPQNDQPRDQAQEIAEKLQPYIGRKLRLKILEVNRKANRLILSEKVALYEERREKRDELFSSLQVSQKVKGTVRSIAPFGVFIDLGGIDGLVHKSELSWNKVNNPEAGYKVGDEVEAEVIDINHERGRISLSIRRLQPDPWHSTVADFKVGDVIDGTVTKLVNFGAFVRVRDGLEGLIHISELSHQRVAHPGDVVHEGQQLKLKIISLDSERHRLGLSLKQAEEPPARPVAEPGQAPAPRGERRPRPERSWSAADAVQEPEGGIDNTLAAAFAQVREQVAASEAASESDEPAAGEPEAAATTTEESAAGEAVPATAEEGEAEAAEPEADLTTTEEAAAGEAVPAAAEPAEAATEPAEAAVEPAEAVAEAAAETTTEPAEAAVEPAEAVAEPAEAAAEPAEAAAEPAQPAQATVDADASEAPEAVTEAAADEPAAEAADEGAAAAEEITEPAVAEAPAEEEAASAETADEPESESPRT